MRYLIAAVCLTFMFYALGAFADDQQPLASREPLTAAQLGQALPPKTVFIVMQCDELVVAWAILQDGSAYRGDPEHAPPADQYAAYLNWLNSAGQVDLYKLPCAK